MKVPRTLKIIRLLTSVFSSVLKGNKLIISESTAQLEALGGIYIKFLQLVVLNLDPQNQVGYSQLLSVYENSQPDDLDINQYLRSQLPAEQLAKIAHTEAKPFATGSFGQVYRAQLSDGQWVVIKILRPSVQKYLRYDLRLLGLLTWTYSLFDRQKILNFRAMFKDFKRTSLREADYVTEAAVADTYYKTYQNHQYVVTPRVYHELSNHSVLTLEYIQGLSVTHLLELQSSGTNAVDYCYQQVQSDLLFLLKTIGAELYCKAIAGDVFQSDPHPGNILILPNNKVALIDFGMAAVVTENRLALYELVFQYQAMYSGKLNIEEFTLTALKCLAPDLYKAIAQADTAVSEGFSEFMFNKLRVAVRDIFEDQHNRPYIDQMLARKQIMRILFFTINKGNRFGFSFDLSTTNLWKATQNYFVLMSKFEPEGYSVLQMFNDIIAFGKANPELILNSPQRELDPIEAVETLSYWFDKMARNDPWLMNKVTRGYFS